MHLKYNSDYHTLLVNMASLLHQLYYKLGTAAQLDTTVSDLRRSQVDVTMFARDSMIEEG